MVSRFQPAVINLGMTKSGKRQGAAESIALTEQHVLVHLWAWKRKVPPHTFLTLKPNAWRALFADCIQKLKFTKWEFRPYSLRRGGATDLFVKTGSLDKVVSRQNRSNLHQVRLGNAFRNSIPKPLLSPFHKVFSSWKSKPSLEQALRESRTGGRGKKRSAQKKIGNKGGGRSLLFWIEVSFLDCLCLALRRWGYPS